MLYAVSVLHMPSGETETGRLLETENGVVKDFYPFLKEKPSVVYVPEVYLSAISGAESVSSLKEAACSCGSGELFAYRLCGEDGLAVLD